MSRSARPFRARAIRGILLEAPDPSRLRMGDLILARLRSAVADIEELPSGRIVTRRVVRVLSIGGERVFFTKADLGPRFDPLVLPDQLRGRVVRAGGRDLARGVLRRREAAIARISYLHGMICHRLRLLLRGRHNCLRGRMEKGRGAQ